MAAPRPHPPASRPAAEPHEADARAALLDQLAAVPITPATPRTGVAPGGVVVGECVDAAHPTLRGRVRVRWETSQGVAERWVPTLQNLPVRVADRVLLVHPGNHDEPVVVGVLDGFARRPEPERAETARFTLQRDEAVRVEGADGQPLVELFQSDAGPVVRLLQADVNVELPGALRISAEQIALRARAGTVEIEASDDVNVRGEVVNLN
ncbi:MAG TPA: hypothetical protein VK610_03250 [Rhodothermales bacterium]|nr:hypothetical protein [Rhodothermales bacterium]